MDTPVPAWKAQWMQMVAAFAEAVDKPTDLIETRMVTVVGEPNEKTLDILADDKAATFDDFKAAFADLKIPIAVLRRNIGILRGKVTVAEVPATGRNITLDVLQQVPDEESFVAALMIGGISKVKPTDVMAGMRASLAERAGLFELPERLLVEIDHHVMSLSEPAGEEYYELRDMLTARSYGDVLTLLKVKGRFMTKRMKEEFISRLDDLLWKSLGDFQERLLAWQQAWNQGGGNPGLAITGLVQFLSGGQMPPGMMAPPPTNALRDAARKVIDDINKIFAGVGIPVARALAYEAGRIKDNLKNPSLPAAMGVASHEQMVRRLGADVSGDYVRLEHDIVQFAINVMGFPDIPTDDQEQIYLAALLQLGLSIPFDKLSPGTGMADFDELVRSAEMVRSKVGR